MIRALHLATLGIMALQHGAGAAAAGGQAVPVPAPDSYWRVSSALDYSDELYAGWPQLEVDGEAVVYRGTDFNRTYAHHPELYYDGRRVYLQYSTAPVDGT